ncbi:MAG: family 10 glycosylhydrolase [Kiritimatiellae bacterium]|nr:family 10 glycosylhydrolase [Kiritimatiellia bacterium]
MFKNKTCYVCATLAAMTAAVAVFVWQALASQAGKSQLTAETLPAARRAAAARKRRVIMNNDGDDARTAPEKNRDGFLQARTAALAGSQVDAIFYCTGLWGTSTHKGSDFEIRKWYEDGEKAWATRLDADGGPDTLGSIIAFGHAHNMEVFWSFRVNDTHDSYTLPMLTEWKKAHPECLVGKLEERSAYSGGGKRWSAVNYAHPLVQDRVVGWFDEIAARYDIDGVEMDFFRHPIFFKSTLRGEEASDAERAAMSSVVRRVREALDKHALCRGRPVLLAIRVPDSDGYCRALGLDVEQWMKEGLVDMMTVSGYFRLNPWSVSVELGGKYGVPVYACLSESRLKDKEFKAIRQSGEGYRGRASEAWAAGVAGIYTFNLFKPQSPVFREVGDPVALSGMDKIITTGARPIGSAKTWLVNGAAFVNRPYPVPERPRSLRPGQKEEISLFVADRVAGSGAQCALRLAVEGAESVVAPLVSWNGRPLGAGTVQGRWIEYPVGNDMVAYGTNSVTVTADEGQKAGTAVVSDLLLRIRYPSR